MGASSVRCFGPAVGGGAPNRGGRGSPAWFYIFVRATAETAAAKLVGGLVLSGGQLLIGDEGDENWRREDRFLVQKFFPDAAWGNSSPSRVSARRAAGCPPPSHSHLTQVGHFSS